jgi:hypothetical protein
MLFGRWISVVFRPQRASDSCRLCHYVRGATLYRDLQMLLKAFRPTVDRCARQKFYVLPCWCVNWFLSAKLRARQFLEINMSCNISFVELLMFLFGVFGGMCVDNSCNVFMILFMVLWVPIFATPCRRAVLMLWHAFLFPGLRFFPLFFFLLGGLHYFFL